MCPHSSTVHLLAIGRSTILESFWPFLNVTRNGRLEQVVQLLWRKESSDQGNRDWRCTVIVIRGNCFLSEADIRKWLIHPLQQACLQPSKTGEDGSSKQTGHVSSPFLA